MTSPEPNCGHQIVDFACVSYCGANKEDRMVRLFVVYSTIKSSQNLTNNCCAEEFGICLFFSFPIQPSERGLRRYTRNFVHSSLAARYWHWHGARSSVVRCCVYFIKTLPNEIIYVAAEWCDGCHCQREPQSAYHRELDCRGFAGNFLFPRSPTSMCARLCVWRLLFCWCTSLKIECFFRIYSHCLWAVTILFRFNFSTERICIWVRGSRVGKTNAKKEKKIASREATSNMRLSVE